MTRIVVTLRDKGLVTQTRDDKDTHRQFIEITLDEENYETLLNLLSMLDQGSKY